MVHSRRPPKGTVNIAVHSYYIQLREEWIDNSCHWSTSRCNDSLSADPGPSPARADAKRDEAGDGLYVGANGGSLRMRRNRMEESPLYFEMVPTRRWWFGSDHRSVPQEWTQGYVFIHHGDCVPSIINQHWMTTVEGTKPAHISHVQKVGPKHSVPGCGAWYQLLVDLKRGYSLIIVSLPN